jgi:DNA-binding MarR family transcriptional regulator
VTEPQEIDRLVHEPGRLSILVGLAHVDEAEFSFLVETLGMTRGNFAAHVARLEEHGLVERSKAFVDDRPRTTYRLTAEGRRRLREYRRSMRALLSAIPG